MFKYACHKAGIDYAKIKPINPGGAGAIDKAFRDIYAPEIEAFRREKAHREGAEAAKTLTDEDILREANVDEADTLVALTNDDKVNLLACVTAKRLGCADSLCLVNDKRYPALARSLGVDAYVNPRAVTISKVLQHVRRGRIRGVHSVDGGAGEIIEAEALETSPLVGKPLRELELPGGVRIGAIARDGEVIIPRGDTRIAANDRVVIFALADRVKQVEQMFRVSLEFF